MLTVQQNYDIIPDDKMRKDVEMSIKAILFDLDGTLLPMDMEIFANAYFKGLSERLAHYGYDPKEAVKAVWAGTKAMKANEGAISNEELFWNVFCGIFGEKAREDKPYFEEFYNEDFEKINEVCGYDSRAAQTVRTLKERGYRVALATSPVFPAVATESRIRWAGLSPDEFELYTTYESISYTKPNPQYYREVARRMELTCEECLMVGNDITDDMVAAETGMKVFLLTDCLINKDDADISVYSRGSFEELMCYVDSLD